MIIEDPSAEDLEKQEHYWIDADGCDEHFDGEGRCACGFSGLTFAEWRTHMTAIVLHKAERQRIVQNPCSKCGFVADIRWTTNLCPYCGELM